MPPPSASSNEWVPVFRAQAAAMNKMAFKAFFITAFSQTERGSCRASDGFRLGKLDLIDYPHSKNVQNVFALKTFSFSYLVRLIQYVHLTYRTTWWGRGVVHLDCEPDIRGSENYIISLNTVYEMYFFI